MKITPISQGGSPSIDLGAVSVGRTNSSDKIERAKQIAQGITISPSDIPVDSQVRQQEQSVRRITMKTNVSPDRQVDYGQESQAESVTETPSDVTPVIEETKPLSPQLAELAKQRRALQVKERELVDREKALKSQPVSTGAEELAARLKSQPLSVLQEYGVTYDQLTEAILAGNTGLNPEIQSLKSELKALKEGVDKTLSERDAQAEQQVLLEIQRDIDHKAASGDDFEMIRVTGKQSEVKELIHRTFKESGEILDTEEAMKLVEDELIRENLEIANTGKLRSRLTPPTPPQQQQPQKQFRTLTNRDTAKPVMDRRSRAMAAALGQLRK